MTGFLSQYGDALRIALAVTVVFVIVAAGMAIRLRVMGGSLQPVARFLAVGSAIVVFIATALPRTWPPDFAPGDLVLRLGDGGLSDWRVLLEDPNSLSSVLLVGNVVLYLPLAALAVLGWPDRRALAPFACLAVSLLVESSQWLLLDGIASLDDVLLNMGGALIGFALGLVFARRGSARSHRSANA